MSPPAYMTEWHESILPASTFLLLFPSPPSFCLSISPLSLCPCHWVITSGGENSGVANTLISTVLGMWQKWWDWVNCTTLRRLSVGSFWGLALNSYSVQNIVLDAEDKGKRWWMVTNLTDIASEKRKATDQGMLSWVGRVERILKGQRQEGLRCCARNREQQISIGHGKMTLQKLLWEAIGKELRGEEVILRLRKGFAAFLRGSEAGDSVEKGDQVVWGRWFWVAVRTGTTPQLWGALAMCTALVPRRTRKEDLARADTHRSLGIWGR